jgi:hypothetical protein
VSSDTDFGALLARSQSSEPSFVLLRHVNDLGVDDQALLLVAVLPTVAGELERGVDDHGKLLRADHRNSPPVSGGVDHR